MAYQDLGSRQLSGAANADNPLGSGFWTIAFTPTVLTIPESEFEIYHISVRGPVGSTFDIYRGTAFWDSVPNGWKNGWDPAQPLPVRSGDTVYLHYSTADNPRPVATVWLRIPD